MSPDGFSGSSIQHGTHHFIKSLIGVSFQCALSIFINQATPKTWNETPSRSESIVIRDCGKTWIYGISKTPHVSKTKRKTKSWTTVDKSGTGTNPDNTKKGSQSPANYVCKHWFPLPLSSVWSTRSCGGRWHKATKYQSIKGLRNQFGHSFLLQAFWVRARKLNNHSHPGSW